MFFFLAFTVLWLGVWKEALEQEAEAANFEGLLERKKLPLMVEGRLDIAGASVSRAKILAQFCAFWAQRMLADLR